MQYIKICTTIYKDNSRPVPLMFSYKHQNYNF